MTLPSVECLCVSGSPYLFVSKHVLLCEPTKGGVCVQVGVPECMAVSGLWSTEYMVWSTPMGGRLHECPCVRPDL